MAVFKVNGRDVTAFESKSLLRFLRDDLRLTGTKDGCSQGGCGACTVLLDGKPVKSCLLMTGTLGGRSVETIEGLSSWERSVYVHAFASAGAVQCGFCTPGMVLCAKALLRDNPSPDEKEIRHALRHNYCRCTGYVKLVKAVRTAAAVFSSGIIVSQEGPVPRVDARDKILGTGKYADDIYLDGMLYGSVLRAEHAHARILFVDITAAEALPGVRAVLTAGDIPGDNITGYAVRDQYTLVPQGEVTHYLGDPVCLVAAEDQETAEKAARLIKVEYEELPAVHGIEEALKNDAQVFEGRKDNILKETVVKAGDADKALASSRYVLSGHFSTPPQEHAYLERECAVSCMKEDGTVIVYSSCQSPFRTRDMIRGILGTDKVEVENPLIGGAFGGKFDLTVQHHAALLCMKTGRPVKLRLSRSESILVHPKRHPFEMDFTLGADEKGRFTALKGRILIDTGGYASFGISTIEKACQFSTGPYVFSDYSVEGMSLYSNNPPGGALRGFAILQPCFAVETLINMLAEETGLSPLELRLINAVRPGMALSNGQAADRNTGFAETLEALRPYIEQAEKEGKPWGLASGIKNISTGRGLKDYGRVRLKAGTDGRVHICSGAACLGQGLTTVLAQIVCEETGLPLSSVTMDAVQTWAVPDSGASGGSRQTMVTGEACRRASRELGKALSISGSLEALSGREFYGEYLAKTDDNRHPHIAYSYASQLCILDPSTGLVDKLVAAHAIGRAINLLGAEGQIEGGVMMSAGFALSERFPLDDCRPPGRFSGLGLLSSEKAPPVVPVIVGQETDSYAVGLGEITCVPTAPAISEAYYQMDGRRRFSLPLEGTPYSK